MRKSKFSEVQIAAILKEAEAGMAVAEVARLELLRPEERLDPGKLIASIEAAGRPAFYLPGADEIVERLGEKARPGDVVCVFSNGGFGGIHDKLLARFGSH